MHFTFTNLKGKIMNDALVVDRDGKAIDGKEGDQIDN